MDGKALLPPNPLDGTNADLPALLASIAVLVIAARNKEDTKRKAVNKTKSNMNWN